ncbi:MAG: UDP-N-acetylmuramoyl-tripeptide--D-alanyl-D-alanine ligase [Bacteroidota bacterium]
MGDRNEVFFEHMKEDYIYKILESNSFNISVDSRKTEQGDVFFALKGDNFNGNEFAGEALKRGAVAAVIDDPAYKTEKTIIVKDAEAALQAVARIHRKKFDIPVLAITGSNGKTTTKEMLARVLSVSYIVHYTRGNLNNHIGVPLTILSCRPGTGFMLIEMGANHVGEIRNLCNIAMPDYGLITNIGKAHLEGFGSLEGVKKAKSELYDYISSVGGTAFYNENDDTLRDLVNRDDINSVPYLQPGEHKIEILEVRQDPGLRIMSDIDGKKVTIETGLFGIHNLENVLAAMAVGLYFDVTAEKIKQQIESYMPDNNRSQILETGKNILICDSYNANPVSMQKSLDAFAIFPGNKKTVILGDMFELGDYEYREHENILRKLAAMDGINVILAGKVFHSMADKYNMLSFSSRDELIKHLEKSPVVGNVVLIKGSRALGLEKVYGMM